jgi:TonB family protein
MSRLHKKCLLASCLGHGLLALILVLVPGWVSSRDTFETLPILEMIPGKLVDEAAFGGGTPNAVPPPPAETPSPKVVEPQPAPQLPPTPPPAEPQREQPPEPKPKEPPPVETPKEKPSPPKPEAEASVPEPPRKTPKKPLAEKQTEDKPAAVKPVVKINTNLVRRPTPTTDNVAAKLKAEREAALATAKRAAEERQERIFSSIKNLRGNLSSATVIGIPGAGGEAYANYGQVLMSLYYEAWNPPAEIEDESASVETTVTIARDGTVLRGVTSIVRRSGIPALDKSVQQALDRVLRTPPFPETAKDSQRTFRVIFNLKAKRSLG